jgi:ubiquitin-conjugating enzyme E2 A
METNTAGARRRQQQPTDDEDGDFVPQMLPPERPGGTAAAMMATLAPVPVSGAASVHDAQKRLMRDLKVIRQGPPIEGITAAPHENDIMKWTAVIFGPEESPWAGGIFKLELIFTAEYPMAPPGVRFLSKMFHPNVYVDGKICMDILKSQWSPATDVSALLLSIRSLLADPNPMSAANAEAAELLTRSKAAYESKVKQVVEESLEALSSDEED